MGSFSRSTAFGLALFCCVVLPVAAAPQAGNGTIYCCESDGQTVCGDILPAVCIGRGYREISPQGIVRNNVPPPLTAEERARRAAEDRRLRAIAVREAKQRQLDQALLETYRSVADIEARRDRALAESDQSIVILREREQELLGRVDALKKEIEGKAEGKTPPALAENLSATEAELSIQRQVVESKLRERDAVRARFEDDRRRYIRLTAPAQHGAEN